MVIKECINNNVFCLLTSSNLEIVQLRVPGGHFSPASLTSWLQELLAFLRDPPRPLRGRCSSHSCPFLVTTGLHKVTHAGSLLTLSSCFSTAHSLLELSLNQTWSDCSTTATLREGEEEADAEKQSGEGETTELSAMIAKWEGDSSMRRGQQTWMWQEFHETVQVSQE